MSDKKKGNKIDTKVSRLDALQAAYVMGVGAARADGVVEQSELNELTDIAGVLGHEEALDDAFSFMELFEDNEDAVNLAVTALEKSTPSAKLAALLLMEIVLAEDGVNKEENAFYEKVLSKIGAK
jgi:hypothetical protein|tara:strand:+ start:9474 stop:9848 length:375 start_codon:yes stop_codon:yes gene_type:complete